MTYQELQTTLQTTLQDSQGASLLSLADHATSRLKQTIERYNKAFPPGSTSNEKDRKKVYKKLYGGLKQMCEGAEEGASLLSLSEQFSNSLHRSLENYAAGRIGYRELFKIFSTFAARLERLAACVPG